MYKLSFETCPYDESMTEKCITRICQTVIRTANLKNQIKLFYLSNNSFHFQNVFWVPFQTKPERGKERKK